MRSAALADGTKAARAAMIPVVMKKLPRILNPALEFSLFASNISGDTPGDRGFQHHSHAVLVIGRGLLPAAHLSHRPQLLSRIAHHYALTGPLQHIHIVPVVADGHGLFAIHTQLGCEFFER